MSRPSVRRGELDRTKDIALIWMIEWLKDVHASLSVMHVIVDNSATLPKYSAYFETMLSQAEELIEKFEEEPA